MNKINETLLWNKFLLKNQDLQRGAFDTANTRARQGKKEINHSQQRLVELFTIQDTETFISCCLEMRKEFEGLNRQK